LTGRLDLNIHIKFNLTMKKIGKQFTVKFPIIDKGKLFIH